MTATADQLRAEATSRIQEAHASFDRCDTDGFMSQWANGVTAERLRLQAKIEDNGGRFEFPALFDLDGNLVPAKLVTTRYGRAWMLLDGDNECDGWFSGSRAQDDGRRRTTNARKGYYIGRVMARAKAVLSDDIAVNVRAIPVRIDGGFSTDVTIVDNGR